MENKVLYSIDLNELLDAIRQIVSEELSRKGKQITEDKLYSASEAVKLFVPEISRQTLHAWTKSGLIPMYKIGGKNFYKYSEILIATKTLKRYKHNATL